MVALRRFYCVNKKDSSHTFQQSIIPYIGSYIHDVCWNPLQSIIPYIGSYIHDVCWNPWNYSGPILRNPTTTCLLHIGSLFFFTQNIKYITSRLQCQFFVKRTWHEDVKCSFAIQSLIFGNSADVSNMTHIPITTCRTIIVEMPVKMAGAANEIATTRHESDLLLSEVCW